MRPSHAHIILSFHKPPTSHIISFVSYPRRTGRSEGRERRGFFGVPVTGMRNGREMVDGIGSFSSGLFYSPFPL